MNFFFTLLIFVCSKVQSPKLEERISALQTLESMCCDKDKSLIIAKSGVAKIIAPFLVDPQTALRAASASALRRIGEGGGYEAYEILLQDDIMTPLTALLKKVKEIFSLTFAIYYYNYYNIFHLHNYIFSIHIILLGTHIYDINLKTKKNCSTFYQHNLLLFTILNTICMNIFYIPTFFYPYNSAVQQYIYEYINNMY